MRAASVILLLGALALPARAEPRGDGPARPEPTAAEPAKKPGEAKAKPGEAKAKANAKAKPGEAKANANAKAKPGEAKASAKARPGEARTKSGEVKASTDGVPGPARTGTSALAPAATAAEPAPDTTPTGALRLDLTPARLFGKDPGLASDRRGAERREGLDLGDDRDWKVHAAQVGAMAAGFAALVGLCGGGNCLLPSVFGEPEVGASPDLQIRKPAKIRSAR